MDDDFKLLKRIAQKWVEPMDDAADQEKTLRQWRKEVAQLMSEVVFYVSSHDGQPTRSEK